MKPLTVRRPHRAIVATLIGAAFAAVNLHYAHTGEHWRPDFDHLWFAARALMRGRDPYPLIGPGSAFEWPFRLNYPLPTLVLLWPIALLPLDVARCVFVSLGFGLLAYAITGDGFQRLPILASAAAYHAAIRAQWSPLLSAALLLPGLQFVYAGKPTTAASLWLARPSKLPIIIGGILCALSFALVPHWPVEWLHSTRSTPFATPILLPGGLLLLLSLLRWRHPNARMLLGLACVPQTAVAYETLYLGLVPHSSREVLAWSLLSWLAFLLLPEGESYAAHIHTAATLNLWLVYTPTLALVLWRGRPRPAETSPLLPAAVPPDD